MKLTDTLTTAAVADCQNEEDNRVNFVFPLFVGVDQRGIGGGALEVRRPRRHQDPALPVGGGA